ncbi:hypothetical protein [Desulfofalx alkaliphila]|uniref:hypothetical protein n=1 Tax=Desulfofalx alkaliphila TaxID=105483 RepID=UPI00068A6250|nr:hypothetical protein [Desulfofalx alkaliphila]
MKKVKLKLGSALLALAMTLLLGMGVAGAESNWEHRAAVNELVQPNTDNHPHYMQRLDNGNYLICRVGHQSPGVFELTPDGQELWSYRGINANSAKRLGNGNTLIADSGVPGHPKTPKVIEVNSRGSIVWQYDLSSLAESPRYAERLGNGNILITLPYEIREVNPSKSVVWRYGTGKPGALGDLEVLSNPVQANRLANGNTLIVDQGIKVGRVFEVNPGGSVVWEYRGDKGDGAKIGMKKPQSATRLSDGSTVIVDRRTDRVIVVDESGQAVRTYGWQQAIKNLPVMNIWYGQYLEDGNLLLTMTLTSQAGRVFEIGEDLLEVKYDRDKKPPEEVKEEAKGQESQEGPADEGADGVSEDPQWLP